MGEIKIDLKILWSVWEWLRTYTLPYFIIKTKNRTLKTQIFDSAHVKMSCVIELCAGSDLITLVKEETEMLHTS